MKLTYLTIVGAGVALFAASQASGAAISVNYDVTGTSTPALATTDVAGVVPVANWNNLLAANIGQPFNYGMTYVDDSGANTTLTVSGSGSGDSWNTAGSPDDIIYGDKSAWGGSGTLSVSNVPYTSYDLYIFPSFWTNEVVNFTIGGNIQTLTNTFSPNTTGGPNFVLNDTYVHFTGLSGDVSVAMQATAGEVHLGGFQIVAVPEPSILGLLALAPAWALRRRRA